jgi:hypothetical protein
MAVSFWVPGFRFSKLDSHELTAETAAFKFQLRVGHRQDHCKRTGKRCVFVDTPSASSLQRALADIQTLS